VAIRGGLNTVKKLTYTKAELLREAKSFSLYYGRLELMSDDMRRRFDEFVQKVKVYEKEKETAI
jgi:hypothetical protein